MVYEIIEKVKKSGKLKKGLNEVTKAIEREEAKLVVIAKDVSPPEIVQHLPILCNEKKIPLVYVDSKEKLGRSAGIGVGTAAIAVTKEGDAKLDIDKIVKASKS